MASHRNHTRSRSHPGCQARQPDDSMVDKSRENNEFLIVFYNWIVYLQCAYADWYIYLNIDENFQCSGTARLLWPFVKYLCRNGCYKLLEWKLAEWLWPSRESCKAWMAINSGQHMPSKDRVWQHLWLPRNCKIFLSFVCSLFFCESIKLNTSMNWV